MPCDMDADQSSKPAVVGTIDRHSFINPSEMSTKVHDLNVEIENDKHEELEINKSHVQWIDGAWSSTEAVDRKIATPAPTNPSLARELMLIMLMSKDIGEVKTTWSWSRKSIYGECIIRICCIVS